jgi:hypothetical protein
MEQKASFTSGSAASRVDPQELQSALSGMLKQTAGMGVPVLNMFGQLQQRRATRLGSAAADLRVKLGAKDPDAIAVADMAEAARDLKVRLDTQVSRMDKWPKPRANEWIVFGTVCDKQGSPAPDLTVRVLDKDQKYDDLLGETETDANGDFSVIYHERDFKETNENLPDLYVMVLDVSGRVLYTSLESVRYEAGRSEYFAIHLGTQKPQRAKSTRKKTEPPAAGKPSAQG